MGNEEEFDFFEKPAQPVSPRVSPAGNTPKTGDTPGNKKEPGTQGKGRLGDTPGDTKNINRLIKELQSQLALFNARLIALEQKPSASQIVSPPAPAISDGMKQDFATAIRTWLSATKPINSKTGKPNPAHDSPEINEKRVRMAQLLVQMTTGGTLEDVLKKTKLTEWWATNGPKPQEA